MKDNVMASIRLVGVTMVACCAAYPLLMFGFGQIMSPETAEGSLVRMPDGQVVGSRLVAQAFANPRYLWPRPSAVDYNASGAGGSNKSPTNPALRERAEEVLPLYGATPERPVPADLVAASGSGLDPHITLGAAEYQADRVASARRIPAEDVLAVIREMARPSEPSLAPAPLVNVLEANLALDRLAQ